MKQGNFDLTGIIDTAEAMEKSGLKWGVHKSEIITSEGINCPSYRAIVREDNSKVLSVMGDGYEPLQNTEVFAFAEQIIKTDNNFTYDHSIVVKEGAKYIVTLKYNGDTEIRKNDHVKSFLNLINGFDGGERFCCCFSAFRPLCQNVLRRLMGQAEIKIKHNFGIVERARLALESINYIKAEREDFLLISKRLAGAVMDKQKVDKFLNSLLNIDDIQEESTRTKNQKIEIENLIYNGIGNNGSSAWDSYNGVTEYVDHHYSTDEKRDYTANFGAGLKLKNKAFALAESFIS